MVREPDPGYPLSSFVGVFSSIFGRAIFFVISCLAAMIVGSWLHIGWLSPGLVIQGTVIVSVISLWGVLFYVALLLPFICFVCFEGSCGCGFPSSFCYSGGRCILDGERYEVTPSNHNAGANVRPYYVHTLDNYLPSTAFDARCRRWSLLSLVSLDDMKARSACVLAIVMFALPVRGDDFFGQELSASFTSNPL